MFTALQGRRSLIVLGVNSGTSIDSIDLAVVRIRRDGRRLSTKLLAGFSRQIPQKLHKAVWSLANSRSTDLDDLVRIDNALGVFLGKAARSIQTGLARKGIQINLIASHGQTIHHTPQKRAVEKRRFGGSLQIGSPQAIATATCLPVVADFRQADIALGNEGAPITVAAMAEIFAVERESRLILNIGGMANFFYFPAKQSKNVIQARDCGPGNSLSDLLTRQLLGQPFDRNGRIALGGAVSTRLLSQLLKNDFFDSKRVSTGREDFGEVLTRKIIAMGQKVGLPKEDIIATAAELTVQSVVKRLSSVIAGDKWIGKLYLTGGGRKNKFFRQRLSDSFPGLEVCLIDQLDIDGDYVEAFAFALMGEKAIRGISSPTVFANSKRKKTAVLGSIIQPPSGQPGK